MQGLHFYFKWRLVTRLLGLGQEEGSRYLTEFSVLIAPKNNAGTGNIAFAQSS